MHILGATARFFLSFEPNSLINNHPGHSHAICCQTGKPNPSVPHCLWPPAWFSMVAEEMLLSACWPGLPHPEPGWPRLCHRWQLLPNLLTKASCQLCVHSYFPWGKKASGFLSSFQSGCIRVSRCSQMAPHLPSQSIYPPFNQGYKKPSESPVNSNTNAPSLLQSFSFAACRGWEIRQFL